MAKKLLIILVNSNPDNPEALGAPFFQATVAAAMDYDVEILMTGVVSTPFMTSSRTLLMPASFLKSVHRLLRSGVTNLFLKFVRLLVVAMPLQKP